MRESPLRKPVGELSNDDLELFPVWKFALGEDDEDDTNVRPVALVGELAPSGLLVVRARFRLADGTEMRGYLTPRPGQHCGVEELQPVIVTATGQVLLWWGVIVPCHDHVHDLYRRLGKSSDAQVFPLRFAPDIPIAGGPFTGEVPGFLVLEDWRTNRARLIK